MDFHAATEAIQLPVRKAFLLEVLEQPASSCDRVVASMIPLGTSPITVAQGCEKLHLITSDYLDYLVAAAGSHTFPEPCCPVPGEETSRPVKAAEDCANEGCKRIACHKYCAPVTSTPDVMIVHRRVFEYPQCSHQQHQHLAQSRAKPSCLPICTLQGVEFMP